MKSKAILINDAVKNRIIEIRETSVMLDSDIALLYGVTTRDINQAVKNNPKKFPKGYVFELTAKEKNEVVENFHHLQNVKFSKVNPKAFNEKGLYMLATILKSSKATATTIAIIEAFSKMREIKRTIIDAIKYAETGKEPKKAIKKVGQLVSDLVVPDAKDLETIAIEDAVEFKFMGILKLSRKVTKRTKK